MLGVVRLTDPEDEQAPIAIGEQRGAEPLRGERIAGRVVGGLQRFGAGDRSRYKRSPYQMLKFDLRERDIRKALAAGKYSIHMIPSEKDWVVIFNKNSEGWGSYDYDEAEDALRVTVTPVEAPFEEWMRFGFDDLAGTSTALATWLL